MRSLQFIDVRAANRHLDRLRSVGVGVAQVAVVTGRRDVRVFGERHRRATSWPVSPDLTRAILKVTPLDCAPGARVAVGPALEALGEILRSGVSRDRLVAELGPDLLEELARPRISGRAARSVAEIHARWRRGDFSAAGRADLGEVSCG